MKISLKVEYACRVMAQLARQYPQGEWSHIDTLAKKEAIPANYLVQILNELRHAGLIVSRRGKHGGYQLHREPKKILLSEIIRAVDAELLNHSCQTDGQSGPLIHKIWKTISEELVTTIEHYSLETFSKENDCMYYI